jgi:protein TonB
MIIWAVIASILLHILFAVIVPNFKFDMIKKERQVLNIEIQNPVPPPVEPQPPVIEPEKPKPIPKVVKPKIKPMIEPVAKPIEPPAPIEPDVPTPPPIIDEVIAVAPTTTPEPETIVIPPPEPTKPNQAEVDDAIGQYSGLLGRTIAKHKSYPKIAIRRGWQGKVILNLEIDGNGNVLSAKVRDSSGHAALDKEAIKMVKKAAPFPKPPVALQSQRFNIIVPVSFKLANS